jgi:undecaprenyl phosphate-alpha-L-ara4FN deformylase
MRQLAIKVDVDTWIGLQEGVPKLLALFRHYAVPASFFIAVGPDNSGKAIRRIFKRGFLHKMWRTNPLRLYGLKTLLRGTFLPPLIIGELAPERLREVIDEGHELGIHGYDHVLWQDRLERLGETAIASEITRAIATYVKALKHSPRSFAAPGWQATRASLTVQDRQSFLYCSDTRGAWSRGGGGLPGC